MKVLLALLLIPFLFISAFAQANSQVLPTDKGTLNVDLTLSPLEPTPGDIVDLTIDFINPQTQKTQEHIDYRVLVTRDGISVFDTGQIIHTSVGKVTIPVEFKEEGTYETLVEVEGILFQPIPLETVTFDILVDKSTSMPNGKDNGGCLIATAAFGSEIAPQVQQLREIRDNIVMQTESGTVFMSGFNQVYYSFSPSVADLERQSPIFKQVVKTTLVPMLTSLSILNHVNISSETDMIGYGLGIIFLNVAMYIGIPTLAIIKFCQFRRK
jgi:hypothetical protein